MNKSARLLGWVGLLGLGVASLQCTKDSLSLPSELGPAKIDLIDGDGQIGVAGDPLPDSLIVRVTNSDKVPVQGVQVVFRLMAPSPGADLIPDTVLTDGDGRARSKWVLGHTAGNQDVQAEVKTDAGQLLTQTFHATALAGPAAGITAIKGDQQTGQIGTALADSLVVKVSDQFGNPVSGFSVSWSAHGGGTVSAATVNTGANGQAAVQRVLGNTAGPQSAEAAAAGLNGSPVVFTHTATSGAATTMVKDPVTDGQFGLVGQELTDSIVVIVKDASGNGVAGRAVLWTIATGGGTVNPTTSTTDTDGKAFTRWTLGPTAGTNTVNAASANLTPVTFTATGTAAQPTRIVAVSTITQSGTAGSPVGAPPSVKVTDANGNPVRGETVTFTVTAGGGTVSDGTTSGTATSIATNASGIATLSDWTLGPTAGNNSVAARALDVSNNPLNGSPVFFNATGQAGAASKLAMSTQPSTSAQSGVVLAVQPVIQLQDALGNPVAQVRQVTVSVTGGGATLAGNLTVSTNANGTATFSGLALSGPVGSYTLTFAASGLTSAVSGSIALSAGVAARLIIATQPSSSAQSGVPFAQQPAIQVADGAGNPVSSSGVSITAAIATGGGNLTGLKTKPTNAQGLATFTDLAIAGAPGPRTLSFSAAGLTGVNSATVTLGAGAGTKLVMVTQPSTTAQSGSVLARQPEVQVQDGSGNPVPQAGVMVHVAVSTGGTLGGTDSAATDATGLATFSGLSISGLVGDYTLTFQATGLTSVTSGNIALSAGAAATIGKSAGDAQNAPAGTAVPIDPAVLVTDAAGNPISGRGVTFAVATGGGSITGGNATTNASGIATVGSWTLGAAAGPNTLTATSTGLSGSPLTFTATGTTGSATQLAITTQPSATAQSGIDIATQPVVRLRDGNGNNVSQANVDITVTVSTGGTLAGTLTVATDASGVASFTDLAISGVVGNYTLSFAATGLTGATSNTIALTAGTAVKLGVNRQPSGTAQSGVAITVQPRIQIQDAAGNSVSQAGTTITASFASGTGTLTNETATTSGAGLATFAGLAITGTVGSYTLQYDATGLTGISSNPITLNPGPADHVTITVQPPPTASSGVELSTQPVIQLRDGAGNAVSQGGTSITASIASGTGGLLTNKVATTDAGGEATFTNLTLSGPAGNFTLRFGGTNLTAAVSNTIALGAGSGSLLFIQTQPSAAAQNGVDFAQQPVIQLRDASNNPVNQPGVVVSASILSGGGTLNGTTTATTNASGLASFTDLAITGVVGSRTLIFSASGFVSATSSAINLTAGAATQLALTTQPSGNVQSGVVFPTQPVVQLRDQSGNNVSQSNVSVDVAIATGGGTLGGTFPINTNASGQAAFTDLAITGTPGAHTLTFSSSGLSSVTSGSMSVTAGLANHLSITTQPSATAQNSVAFPQQPTIQLRDAAGNPVSQGGVQVTASIASGGGTISGTTTVNTNASGLATFGNLEITGTVGSRTLQFTAGPLGSVTSATIDLEAGAAATIDVSAGDGQTADAGTPVAVPPRVVVADVSGNPVSGVNVTFAPASGGGSVVPTTAVATGVNGLAAVTSWTLGNTPGTNTLTATSTGLSGSPVTFTASGVAGAPTKFTITTQPSSTARNAIAFPQQPVLQLRDAQNNPVSQNGVQITASIASGGGSLGGSSLTVNTDVNGVATFPDLEITGTVGPRTLSFASSGLTGATSNVINLVAGDPTSIVEQAGDGQTATVGQPVAVAPSVLVRDVSGNPVDNVAVTFAVESGGGSATGLNATTDNNGLASVGGWTLGTTAGSNTLSGTSGSLTGSPVTFTATGTPDVADATQSTAVVPDGTAGTPTVITIQARDQFGNALTSGGSNVEVTVTGANSDNATVTDNGNGTYSATYLPVLSGADTITITLDGSPISGSPFTSNVL